MRCHGNEDAIYGFISIFIAFSSFCFFLAIKKTVANKHTINSVVSNTIGKMEINVNQNKSRRYK